MRSIILSALVVLVIVGLDGCFTQPSYPIAPQIQFDGIYYTKATQSLQQDEIVLSLKFTDGDGDLGLDNTISDPDSIYSFEQYPPYTYQGELINYKLKRTSPNLRFPDGTTLGTYDFVTPYNCTNWKITTKTVNNVPVVQDTIFFVSNPNYYNIFVDFLVEQSDGSFQKFDLLAYFGYPNCELGFNGRFPNLTQDPGKKSPLDGKLTYKLRSLGFDVIFGVKTLKLSITIQDRALNKSNTIETPEFTLATIRQGG